MPPHSQPFGACLILATPGWLEVLALHAMVQAQPLHACQLSQPHALLSTPWLDSHS